MSIQDMPAMDEWTDFPDIDGETASDEWTDFTELFFPSHDIVRHVYVDHFYVARLYVQSHAGMTGVDIAETRVVQDARRL